MTEQFEPRTQIGPDGKLYVGVTSAMKLVKFLLEEPAESYGPPALARIHQLEGVACHAVCLDFLAHTFGWLPEYTVPVWPDEHGDQSRWYAVLAQSQKGFAEFVEEYQVEPIAIEAEGFSPHYGLVGHVDLFCSLKWGGRRVKAIVDLKFVSKLMKSHRLQVRCYARLNEFKGANLGLLYHADRTTGLWKLERVDLTTGLEDLAAVSYAAQLYGWAEKRKG
jgi:hypothetical protein